MLELIGVLLFTRISIYVIRNKSEGMTCMGSDKSNAKPMTIDARRKRVNRIKKMIVLIIVVFLLLPSILCLTLWVKVVKLEKNLDKLLVLHEQNYPVEHIGEEENTVIAADVDKDTIKATKAPAKKKKKVVDHSKIKGKKVYLTFDDGPSGNTEKILDILLEYNIKATFFVIGQTDEHSVRMYKRIYDEGHTLAMHSYTHQYKNIYKSVDAFRKDIDRLSDLLYEITGERPKFIRFPGGSSNTVSNVSMKKIIAYSKEAGLIYFDWNVINGDATGEKMSNNQMIESVISGVQLYETSMVLMHDCAGKAQTVETLPSIIDKLKKMKVNLLPINETTIPIQHIKVSSID